MEIKIDETTFENIFYDAEQDLLNDENSAYARGVLNGIKIAIKNLCEK